VGREAERLSLVCRTPDGAPVFIEVFGARAAWGRRWGSEQAAPTRQRGLRTHMSGNARSDGRALGVARQPIVGDRLPRRGIRSKLPEFRSNSWINRRPHPTAPRSWRDPWGSRVKPRCGSTGQCTDVAHCARHELPGEAAICHTPASCAIRARHHPGPSLALGTRSTRPSTRWLWR
jgi:hypothetical protein